MMRDSISLLAKRVVQTTINQSITLYIYDRTYQLYVRCVTCVISAGDISARLRKLVDLDCAVECGLV